MEQQNQTLARYYAKKKKTKKRKIVAFYTFLIVLLISVITVLSLTVFFNISKITVIGNEHYSVQKIVEVSGLEKGQNMFRLNKFKIIENLKKELPYLSNVEINRKLPVAITITVTESQPFLCINTSKGSYLLDESLKILEKTDTAPSGVASVSGIKITNAKIGEPLVDKNGRQDHLKQLCETMQKHFGYGRVTKITIKEVYDITVKYEDRVLIKFGTLENIDQKVQLVKYVLDENSPNEHAQIDVSSGKRAYYKADD